MAIQATATTHLVGPRTLLDKYLWEAAEAMAEQRRELGKQILAARLGKRWKQKQLAAAVSVEPDTVSRWERGQHAPDLDTLDAIARATGHPISFFVDDPPPAVNGTASEARLEGLLERVIELLEEMQAQRAAQPGLAEEVSGRRG
jgi:transcriptional regulator with XRE-family HTH domain